MHRKQNLSIATIAVLALSALALVSLMGCQSRTDRTDGGGVLLSISQFQLAPTQFVLHKLADPNALLPFVPTVTLQNVIKDPSPSSTSMLENIELTSYQVVYSRADTGKRVPPPLVAKFGGVVPVNGTLNITNLNVIANNQVDTLPISDLVQFGVDRETNSTIITLNLSITFFGRTLSGKDVASTPAGFTMEVFQ